jgi:predicted amidophosphoribosyltransferase
LGHAAGLRRLHRPLRRHGDTLPALRARSAALTAIDYDHPWDGLITHFKFHAALDLAPALAERMLHALHASGWDAPTLLLPIPLSIARLRERGYNQAWELAKRLGAALPGATVDATLLLRVKDTPHQLAFPPEQRAGNVRAAFAIEPKRRARCCGPARAQSTCGSPRARRATTASERTHGQSCPCSTSSSCTRKFRRTPAT